VKWATKDMFIDLGAERILAAQKGTRKIAVEVKSFLGLSDMAELEQAIGQYTIYHEVLSRVDPDRSLFLAVDEEVYVNLFEDSIGKLLVDNRGIQLIVFDPQTETIRQWLPPHPIAN
jgi:XisH protein